MFDHILSEMCYFGKKCSNNMCPYQHEHEVIEPVEKDLNEKFDNLEYDEQCESRKILCDKLCKPSHDYHRCNNKEYEKKAGAEQCQAHFQLS